MEFNKTPAPQKVVTETVDVLMERIAEAIKRMSTSNPNRQLFIDCGSCIRQFNQRLIEAGVPPDVDHAEKGVN